MILTGPDPWAVLAAQRKSPAARRGFSLTLVAEAGLDPATSRL